MISALRAIVIIMEEYNTSTMSLIFTEMTTNGSNETMDQNNEDTDNIKVITRMVQLIVRPILIVFGTIGNFLSFYIMRKGSLKKVSTCYYMSILALADTGK